MIKNILLLIVYWFMLPSLSLAGKPVGSVYIEGKESNVALILAHGKSKHPTWLVVDPLRVGVNKQLGYHTLSLQMPVDREFWEDYAADFPLAYDTINDAIRFLREEKGITKIFLMGHSMGSRMVSAYVAKFPINSLAGLIIVGCRNNGTSPLSCDDNVSNTKLPILDIWGNASSKDYDAANDRRYLISNRYQQIAIPNAGHRFEGYETELITSVVDWLLRNP